MKQTKTCTKCGRTRPTAKFGANKKTRDGLDSWCNPCRALSARARYLADPEKYKRLRKVRTETSNYDRLYTAKYRRENPEKCRETNRKWRARNKDRIKAYDATKRGSLERRAHDAANNAIKTGRLKHEPCAVCGFFRVVAHHEDYNKPLDVVWLCREHHGARHREINEERRRAAA